MKQSLPKSKQFAFAIGQLGWSTLMGIIGAYLVYVYTPPQEAGIPLRIPIIAIFGFLSVIGLVTMLGRFIDAITDPWIATLSDRSKHPKGRRISFMSKGAIPLALFTVLVFWSPVDDISEWNVAWLTVTLLAFYIFYTMYVTPYFALISELGHTPEERLNLSTYISLTFIVGTAIASAAPVIWGALEGFGIEKLLAIRLSVTILAVFALICMYVPIWAINEREYSDSKPSDMSMWNSIRGAFSNRDFVIFACSDLVYFLALTTFTTGMIYYITVLLQQPESLNSVIVAALAVSSLIFYPLVNWGAKKWGKKPLLLVAFSIFFIIYFLPLVMGDKLPIEPTLQAYIMVALFALPMAIFGILPNAVVADIAEYDKKVTGVPKEAMFFGARTFMQKLGQMLAMLVFGSALLLGNEVGNDLGIRITGPIAAFFCLIGLILMSLYNEKKIIGKDTASVDSSKQTVAK
ncbi:MFS transporter [Bacillus sp. HMF5848]|uniref:MFS transporter n=1 Tax=Bacillus sp. HMF5848 TaxID=2495421 RepID=UPI000F7751B7|nr:MFS transporter [Bacillus sp. HMF5848]RSK28492.1 MFS transporter [Bacillus sp. HMF5848]